MTTITYDYKAYEFHAFNEDEEDYLLNSDYAYQVFTDNEELMDDLSDDLVIGEADAMVLRSECGQYFIFTNELISDDELELYLDDWGYGERRDGASGIYAD